MRLWLSKNSEVPLREQLVTQVVLGVVSGDLGPGQRLPSTRELARRFRIHSNTVSAAYRELAERGWVEFRKGSGIYVRAHPSEDAALAPGLDLDRLIATFLNLARERGFTLGEIRARVRHWLELQPPDHFLVIESDEELRRILVAEIEEATGWRVSGASPEEAGGNQANQLLMGAAVVALYGQAERVAGLAPPGKTVLLLHSRSVPESLQGERPPEDALISIVSRWSEFLHWSRVILVAAGLDPQALDFRDARADGWDKGLRSSTFVITDALTLKHLPAGCSPRVFRIIADSSLAELQEYIQQQRPNSGPV